MIYDSNVKVFVDFCKKSILYLSRDSDVLNATADNRYDDGPLPRYGLITLFTQSVDRPCRSINNDTR